MMIGTIGLVAIFSLLSDTSKGLTDPDFITTISILGGVIALILIVGLISSRKYLATTQTKTIQVAEGEAQVGKLRPNSAYFDLVIGKHKIRLLTLEQIKAFQIGTAYRPYYLSGPIPTILSAEVIGTEAETSAFREEEGQIEQDQIVQAQQKGRRVVWVMVVLALGFPLILFVASAAGVPSFLQMLLWFGLFALGLLFVVWVRR